MQNKPLNILLVISKMGKGGAQRIVLDLANGFAVHEANVELLVFYRTPQDQTLIDELDPRVRLLNVFNISLASDHKNQFQKFLPVILAPLLACWWVITGRLRKYDIVHSSLLLASVFSWFAFSLQKVLGLHGPKFVETFHADLIALAKWEQSVYFFLWKQKDALVTELRRKDFEIIRNKLPGVQVFYIPFGIIPLVSAGAEDRSRFMEKYSIRKDVPIILSITRLNNKEKKILTLVDVIHRFRQIYPGEFVYLIVGDGPDRSITKARSDALGLSDVICFTGYFDNINIPSSLARIFLITGVEDLVGIAGLQAASLGVPIVSYQVDPEWKNHDPIFYNSTLVDVLAEEIKELLEKEEHYRQASMAASQAVKLVFSVDQMVTSYLSLYIDLRGG